MTSDPVRAIAAAVLYEGYVLWPYRRSALKNQQRFTFGGVYPAAFAEVGGDRAETGMECLLETGADAAVEVTLRWLHLVQRQPLMRGEPVDELVVGGRRHLAWEEATERELSTGWRRVGWPGDEERDRFWSLCDENRPLWDGFSLPVHVPDGSEEEPLGPEAALRRSWEELQGHLAVSAAPVAPSLTRLSVGFRNASTWPGRERAQALRRSFLSAHLVARCRGGAFVSATDPPDTLEEPSRACRQAGLWPVLVGEAGERDTVLGSPIILGDYPSVAPESPGDLFDGGEIDALLIHSIRGLTDAEREEMKATDPRTREILERSLDLSGEQMLRLYGAVREMRRVES
jgi:hypothetical protein